MGRYGVAPEPGEIRDQFSCRDELADREILRPVLRAIGERFGREQLAGQ